MKRLFAKLENNTITIFKNPLVYDGKKIFNPTDQQLLKAGYKNYEPATLEPEKASLSNYSVSYTEDSFTIYQQYNYTLNPEKAMSVYTGYAQDMMDNAVKSRNYDSIASACSYFNSTNEKFASEANTCIRYRDSVWLRCYELLDEVLSGQMLIPSKDDFLALLPSFSWNMYDETETDDVENTEDDDSRIDDKTGTGDSTDSDGSDNSDNTEEENTESGNAGEEENANSDDTDTDIDAPEESEGTDSEITNEDDDAVVEADDSRDNTDSEDGEVTITTDDSKSVE